MLEQFKTQYQKHYANDADDLERSSETKAHSETSMNVSDVKVTDDEQQTIKANNKIVKKPLGYTSEDAINGRIASIEYRVCVNLFKEFMNTRATVQEVRI